MNDYEAARLAQEEREQLFESQAAFKNCRICHTSLGIFSNKIKVADGNICEDCFFKNVVRYTGNKAGMVRVAEGMTTEQLLAYVDKRREEIETIKAFQPTAMPCRQTQFDDISKTMALCSHPQKNYTPECFYLFSYDQIVDFELLENGGSIASGGFGRALTGGILFGGAGAVIGAATRKGQATCSQLVVKITMKNYDAPAFYIYLINNVEVKKNSSTYISCMKIGQDLLSKLQLIVKEIETEISTPVSGTIDAADEIRKFKSLMDDGIISAEEFEMKKKQLLGI